MTTKKDPILENLRHDLINLKNIINSFEDEVRKPELNRVEIKFQLNRILPYLTSIKDCLYRLENTCNKDEKIEFSNKIKSAFEWYIKLELDRSSEYEYEGYSEVLEDIIDEIREDAKKADLKEKERSSTISVRMFPQLPYSDLDFKNYIYNYINIFKVFIKRIDSEILEPLGKGITNYFTVEQFLIENPLDLDENWIVAVCYLSIIDILVNKKREQFGIVKDERTEINLPFPQKFIELITEIKDRGLSINEEMLGFQNILRDFRTQVIHKGFNPSKKEIDLIIEWSEKTIEELNKLKP